MITKTPRLYPQPQVLGTGDLRNADGEFPLAVMVPDRKRVRLITPDPGLEAKDEDWTGDLTANITVSGVRTGGTFAASPEISFDDPINGAASLRYYAAPSSVLAIDVVSDSGCVNPQWFTLSLKLDARALKVDFVILRATKYCDGTPAGTTPTISKTCPITRCIDNRLHLTWRMTGGDEILGCPACSLKFELVINDASEAQFQVDDIVIAEGQDPVWYDIEDDFEWLGAKYKARCFRRADAPTRRVNLGDIFSEITQVTGFGAPTFEAAADDGTLQSDRVVSVTGVIGSPRAGRASAKAAAMQMLTNINSTTGKSQPVRFVWRGVDCNNPCAAEYFVEAQYLTGLEQSLQSLDGERVTVQWRATTPITRYRDFGNVILDKPPKNLLTEGVTFVNDVGVAEALPAWPALPPSTGLGRAIAYDPATGYVYATDGGGNVRQWNGEAWSVLGSAFGANRVYRIVIGPDGVVYVVGGPAGGPGFVYFWNGEYWDTFGTGVFTGGQVRDLLFHSSGRVFACGAFTAPFAAFVELKSGAWAYASIPTTAGNVVNAMVEDCNGRVFCGGEVAFVYDPAPQSLPALPDPEYPCDDTVARCCEAIEPNWARDGGVLISAPKRVLGCGEVITITSTSVGPVTWELKGDSNCSINTNGPSTSVVLTIGPQLRRGGSVIVEATLNTARAALQFEINCEPSAPTVVTDRPAGHYTATDPIAPFANVRIVASGGGGGGPYQFQLIGTVHGSLFPGPNPGVDIMYQAPYVGEGWDFLCVTSEDGGKVVLAIPFRQEQSPVAKYVFTADLSGHVISDAARSGCTVAFSSLKVSSSTVAIWKWREADGGAVSGLVSVWADAGTADVRLIATDNYIYAADAGEPLLFTDLSPTSWVPKTLPMVYRDHQPADVVVALAPTGGDGIAVLGSVRYGETVVSSNVNHCGDLDTACWFEVSGASVPGIAKLHAIKLHDTGALLAFKPALDITWLSHAVITPTSVRVNGVDYSSRLRRVGRVQDFKLLANPYNDGCTVNRAGAMASGGAVTVSLRWRERALTVEK